MVRWPRAVATVAFAGAALLGVTAVAPVGAAPAPTRPGYVYSSMLTAIGLRTQLDSNPEPSSVPDLTDVETPESDGQLDSFGTEDASGHVGNLNGLGNLPGLLCEATGGTPFDCSNVPTGGTTGFPPPDPLDAHASYPTPAHAAAPTAGSQPAQAMVAGGPLTGSAGTANADVSLTSTTTTATLSNVGVDSVMTVGSITTTSTQSVDATAVTSHAQAALSGIGIGNGLAGAGFVNISSVTTTSDATSKPGSVGSDVTTTQVGGVTVLGQPATIDSSGVHVVGSDSLPAAAKNAYQQLLDNDLAASGISIRTIGISRGDDDTGHTVQAGGLLITLQNTVSGAPSVAGGLPAGVPCPIEPVTSQFPVDPCGGVGFSPDAAYFGNIQLGATGILSNATVNTFTSGLGSVTGFVPPSVPTEAPGSDAPVTVTPGTSSPATVTRGGTPTTVTPPGVTPPGGSTPPVTTGAVASGNTPTLVGDPTGQPPALAAGGTAAVAAPEGIRAAASTFTTLDPLAGSTRRLLYLFPMMILIGIGILAGRLRKVPPRIPGATS